MFHKSTTLWQSNPTSQREKKHMIEEVKQAAKDHFSPIHTMETRKSHNSQTLPSAFPIMIQFALDMTAQ